jgi:hypothetical protein
VTVGLPYYGLLAFAAAGAAGADLLPVEIEREAVTAYAVARDHRVESVVILNWSETVANAVSLARFALHHPRVLRLTAPSLRSQDAVQFGEAEVDAMGRWSPKSTEQLRANRLTLAPASAAVIQSSSP